MLLSELLVNEFNKENSCCGGCFPRCSTETLRLCRCISLVLEWCVETKSPTVCLDSPGVERRWELRTVLVYMLSSHQTPHSQRRRVLGRFLFPRPGVLGLVHRMALPSSPLAEAGHTHFLLQEGAPYPMCASPLSLSWFSKASGHGRQLGCILQAPLCGCRGWSSLAVPVLS